MRKIFAVLLGLLTLGALWHANRAFCKANNVFGKMNNAYCETNNAPVDVSHTYSQVSGAQSETSPKLIKIVARKFEFNPSTLVLKRGEPVVLQLSTEDRLHGFNLPGLNLHAEINPGKITELRLTPDQAGEFEFSCDVFCGDGHEDMNGQIRVID